MRCCIAAARYISLRMYEPSDASDLSTLTFVSGSCCAASFWIFRGGALIDALLLCRYLLVIQPITYSSFIRLFLPDKPVGSVCIEYINTYWIENHDFQSFSVAGTKRENGRGREITRLPKSCS